MPQRQGVDHGRVDGALVQERFARGVLTRAMTVNHHEAILLTDEMKNGDVGKNPPEHLVAETVERDASQKARQRRRQVEESPAGEFVRLKIGPMQRCVDMRHVYEDNEEHPAPDRGLLGPHGRQSQDQKHGGDRRPDDEPEVETGRCNPAGAHTEVFCSQKAAL